MALLIHSLNVKVLKPSVKIRLNLDYYFKHFKSIIKRFSGSTVYLANEAFREFDITRHQRDMERTFYNCIDSNNDSPILLKVIQ